MKDKKYVYVEKEPYVYELNTYNKNDAKENIDVIEESLNDTKISLSKYLQDVDTLHDNADNDGLINSLKSFELLQNNLINELQVNSAKVLSNKSNAVPLKVNRNRNNMVSVEKVTKPRKNFELGNLTTKLVGHNNNRDNFHFSNKEDNRMVLTIGNYNTDPLISVGSVIQVEGTTNYNGFFQCKDVLHKYKNLFEDGQYEFFAAGLRHKADEDHSQTTKVSVHNSAVEAVMIGASATQMKQYTLSSATTTGFSASSTNVSSLKIECVTDGQIKLTGGTGITAALFPASCVVKVEGSQIPEYNGYFLATGAGDGSTVSLYGGSTEIYKANHLATETSNTAAPFVKLSVYIAANVTDVSSVTSVGVSQDLSKSMYIAGAGTLQNTTSTFALAENNGLIHATVATTALAAALVFGQVVRLTGSTNYDGYYMVAEDVTGTINDVIKLYAGDSELNYADEAATASVDLYYHANTAFNTVSTSESENNIFALGTATVADITAYDEADGFLQFQNRDDELIKMTIGMYLNSPNISVGIIVNIKNTAQYDGMWAVKSVDTIHSSTVHGVYTLLAPGLEGKSLEKHYSDASISMYASNVEQQAPLYHNMAGTKNFSIKLNNCNKHVAFYVPGFSVYTDDAGLLEILYAEKENNLDIVHAPADSISRHRLSGKCALPSNLEELKEMYLQIVGNGQDLDGLNPNKDIVKLINNLEIATKGFASIKNAPYLY